MSYPPRDPVRVFCFRRRPTPPNVPHPHSSVNFSSLTEKGWSWNQGAAVAQKEEGEEQLKGMLGKLESTAVNHILIT